MTPFDRDTAKKRLQVNDSGLDEWFLLLSKDEQERVWA